MKVTVRCACVRVCRRVGSAVCEGVEHMERAIQGVGGGVWLVHLSKLTFVHLKQYNIHER